MIAALVVGVLLLPSASRAPLLTASTATTTASHGGTGPVTAPSHQGSSTHSHGHHSSTTTTTLPAPATIHVLVANGTQVAGAAGDVTSFLETKGFSTLQAVNATGQVQSSAVFATGGSLSAADEVASDLGLSKTDVIASSSAPVPSDAGTTVVVVVGPDLASRYATTTTTAASGAASA